MVMDEGFNVGKLKALPSSSQGDHHMAFSYDLQKTSWHLNSLTEGRNFAPHHEGSNAYSHPGSKVIVWNQKNHIICKKRDFLYYSCTLALQTGLRQGSTLDSSSSSNSSSRQSLCFTYISACFDYTLLVNHFNCIVSSVI